MKIKKVMFIVLCVLLALVIILTGVVISKIIGLTGGGANPSNPTQNTTAPTETQTDPTNHTTVPPVTVPPTTVPSTTVPPTTEPTETEHVHDWVLTESMEATCENYGYKIYTCSECGKQDIPYDEQTKPLGHSFGPGETVAPTCTEEGYTQYTCATCKKTEKRNVKPAAGHDFVLTESVEAGCETGGYEVYTCSSCALEEIRNEAEALGHSYVLVGAATEATCTEAGTATYQCGRCEDEIQESTPALGHSYVLAESEEANCIEDGYSLYKCNRCGNDYLEIQDAYGHSFGSWTEGEEGGIERSCTVCDLLQTSADLKITNDQVSVDDENGRVYMIHVGTDDQPSMFYYMITDQLANGTLAYTLDEAKGLVITYTNAAGEPVEMIQAYLSTDPIVIPAE